MTDNRGLTHFTQIILILVAAGLLTCAVAWGPMTDNRSEIADLKTRLTELEQATTATIQAVERVEWRVMSLDGVVGNIQQQLPPAERPREIVLMEVQE